MSESKTMKTLTKLKIEDIEFIMLTSRAKAKEMVRIEDATLIALICVSGMNLVIGWIFIVWFWSVDSGVVLLMRACLLVNLSSMVPSSISLGSSVWTVSVFC